MRLPKSLFVYRRSPYYITEICSAIAVIAVVFSLATKNDFFIKYIFIIIPIVIMFGFAAEGIGRTMPSLRNKQWSKAIAQLLPYILGIMVALIVVVATISMFRR